MHSGKVYVKSVDRLRIKCYPENVDKFCGKGGVKLLVKWYKYFPRKVFPNIWGVTNRKRGVIHRKHRVANRQNAKKGGLMYSKMKRIKFDVAQKWGVSVADLEGKSRKRMIVRARQEAIARCRADTECSYSEIACYFGSRHHSTIIHAIKVYKENPAQF